MYRTLKLLTASFAAMLPLLFVVGCSKKEEKKDTIVLQSDILKKLPASTYGFITWDTSSKAYERFQTSFASMSNQKWFEGLLTDLAEFEKSSTKKITPILQWLAREGFIQLAPNQKNSIARGLAFFEMKQDVPIPAIGLYTEGENNVDLSKKLTSFQSLLKQEGVESKPYSSSGIDGFEVMLKEATPTDETTFSLFFAADKKRFIAASSTPLLHNLFQEGDGAGINAIRSSEQYKKVMAELPERGNELSFAFLNIQGLLQRVAPLLPVSPEEAKQLNQIPVDALAASSQMNETFVSNIGVLFNQGLNSFGNMKKALSSTQSWSPLNNHPKNAVFALSLSETVLKTIQEIALSQETDPQKKALMASQMESMGDIKSINLSILQGDAASFLPGLIVSAHTPKQQELFDMIRGTLGALTAGGGMPTSGWQKTNIENTDVDYMMSPMGVGAYLAKHGDSLLVTTSQPAMMAALKAKAGKETLQASLSKQDTKPLSGTSPLVATYLDAESLASLVQQMQGSLAMFTGGQNPVQPDQIEQIRQMGRSLWAGFYSNDVLRLWGTTKPAKQG